jgi:nitroreductase
MHQTTLDIIRQRRSHRKYTAEQLTQAQLDAILDAALASPSAMNLQPWHFSVVQDSALLNRIHQEAAAVALAREPDMRSPRYDDPDFQIFYHAPTVIFLSAPTGSQMGAVDCGIAVYGIALAAESLGLGSVILGLPRDAFAGSAREEVEQALQFPEGHHFVVAIALGHPADTKDAHEKHPEKITIIR